MVIIYCFTVPLQAQSGLQKIEILYDLFRIVSDCICISKSTYERFCAVSVAVPFCVFDDKDHNFTASFVIRFINGYTAIELNLF